MSSTQIALVEIVDLLHKECLDIYGLMEKTGLHRQTIEKYLGLFHRRGLVRAAEWWQAGNHVWVAKYEWNPDGLPSVRKPRKVPLNEAKARYKEKIRKRKCGIL